MESPGASARAVRRTHLQFSSDQAAQEFESLASRRQSGDETQRVLTQLLSDKQRELLVLDGRLKGTFAVEPDKKYQYDTESKTLYELVAHQGSTPGPDEDSTPVAGLERRVSRQFDEETTAHEFLRLLAAKQVINQELEALRLLLREKQLEQERTQLALNNRYSMVPERDYQFDRESRTLYELVPVPPSPAAQAATP